MRENIEPKDVQIMDDLVNMAAHNIDDVASKSVAARLDVHCSGKLIETYRAARHTFKNLNEQIIHDTWHAEEFCLVRYRASNYFGNNRYFKILYCTMEPCTQRVYHSKNLKHKSCCDQIIETGIDKVIIASKDNWYGEDGVATLEKSGVMVEFIGGFEKRIEEINKNNCIEKEVAKDYINYLEEMKKDSIEKHKQLIEAKQARIRQ